MIKGANTVTTIRERAAGLAHTDVTNELARALAGVSPNIVIGQVDEAPPPAAGFSLKWGKATSDVSGNNTVTLDPCSVAGTDNGEANIVVYLTTPLTYTFPANTILITTGQNLAYIPFTDASGNPSGVLVSPPLKLSSCTTLPGS
jgi:hypothetical protein